MNPARVGALAILALALLACDGPAAAPAPDEGAAALLRVVEAERTLAYTGWRRTICGREGEGRATVMKISRPAAGPAFLEWEGDGVPARKWTYRSRFAWLDAPDLLLANYEVALDPAPGRPIAWRQTRALHVTPRHPGRPSLELLVDRETWLVLREVLTSHDGRTTRTGIFDSIVYGPPGEDPASAGNPNASKEIASAAVESLPDPVRPEGRPRLPLAVGRAPAGFRPVRGERTSDGGFREDWSDGLAAFSVVESSARGMGSDEDRTAPREGELARRQCSGRALVSAFVSGMSVSVAGTLPAQELEAIVRGLTREPDPAR